MSTINDIHPSWSEPIPFSSRDTTDSLHAIMHDLELLQFLGSHVMAPSSPLPIVTPKKLPSIYINAACTYPMSVQRSVSSSSRDSFASTVDGDFDDDNTTPREAVSPPRRKTCAMTGCARNVRSKGYCKTHGGGKQCMMQNCNKEAQNGNYCIGHGGGKVCKVEGCVNAAQSQGLCKAHGGGARCKYDQCDRSSQGGGFCRTHGGGKRCVEPGCTKGAQRGNQCAKHGGCRTCTVGDCGRTDRGGGYCELHRKDKLCVVAGCKRLRKSLDMCTPHVREWRTAHSDKPTRSMLLQVHQL
ncbi:hypothetical protein AeRB84_019606 [Aphanomyces euteiches]|nr:hypothetical protein AeRB84_019606 [Aphanomyces euteiches]